MAESRVGTNQKDDILAGRAKLLREHQFARTLAYRVKQAPQEEAAATPPETPATEPTLRITPPASKPQEGEAVASKTSTTGTKLEATPAPSSAQQPAVAPKTSTTETSYKPTTASSGLRNWKHSAVAGALERNGSAPFDSADAVSPAPTGEQQIIRDLAGMKLDSKPNMFLNAKQQEQSRLMSLPAELRNHIYAYSLGGVWLGLHDYDESDKDKLLDARNAPGILLTCKRIHQEAIGIFYSTAIFSFPLAWCNDEPIFNTRTKQWLTSIGYGRASQIKKIGACARLQRVADLRPWEDDDEEDDFMGYDEDEYVGVNCVKDMNAVRQLAEGIYGRTVWGPEVVKSRLIFKTWHGDFGVWTSDPRKICAAAFAAYKFSPASDEDGTCRDLMKWSEMLEEHDARVGGSGYFSRRKALYDDWVDDWFPEELHIDCSMYSSPENFAEWDDEMKISEDPWSVFEGEFAALQKVFD
ncbi:unnamed protein product [Cercospora beticola]|nr:unnamed protein product [Cercospora beticola]